VRLLYLDDSGKTDPKHSSRFVLYAGLAVSDQEWANLHKRLTGAKAKFFPTRGAGRPNDWELKTADFLKRNPWQRKKNRDFCYELVRILRRSDCSVYAVAAEKARATRTLDETWLVPLMYQRLTAKFIDEVSQKADSPGAIVCDWTSYKLDHHISACVQSYAVSRGYHELLGGVTYGSSSSFTAIQAADLISGAFRIWYEGGTHLDGLIEQLTALQYQRAGARCVEGFPMTSVFRIF
jgi:Protein of unknown function (DUF3800)